MFETRPELFLTIHKRSAADSKVTPSQVRTLQALVKSLVYLEENIMDQGRSKKSKAVSESDVFIFVDNRIRAIKRDLEYNRALYASSETIVEVSE